MDSFEYVGKELDVFALAVNWKRYFGQLIGPFVQGDVLEVGAGLGETTRALWNDGVVQWVCLEPDARLASRLEHLELPHGQRPEIVIGDITAVPEVRRFDTIVYIDVLEHIRADVDELRAATSRLRVGGHLVVLAPAFPILFSAFDEQLGHERRYTQRTLSAVFPPELVRTTVVYADSVGMILSLANRLLLRQALPNRRQILLWDRVVIPLSRRLDPLLGRAFGRSVIAVYRRP
jgi:SAM-dependent methyltransferase